MPYLDLREFEAEAVLSFAPEAALSFVQTVRGNMEGFTKREVEEDVGDGRRPIYYDPQEQELEDGHEDEDEEESCHEGFTRFSRQQRQCFQCRQQKIKEESYYSQVRWEMTREVSRCTQLVLATEWRVRSCFGFLPNLALSIHKNAREVMGDTSPGCSAVGASAGAVDPKTHRKWVWAFIDAAPTWSMLW